MRVGASVQFPGGSSSNGGKPAGRGGPGIATQPSMAVSHATTAATG